MLPPAKTDFSDSHPVKVNSLDSRMNCSHILHGKQNEYFAEWAGHLSLKSFLNGQAFYDVGTGRYAVSENSYLLLNEMQPYSITIDSETKVESFCIFFESDFAEEVSRSLTASNGQLLDNPEKPFTEKINFIPRIYPQKDLSGVLSELRLSVEKRKDDQAWLKEKLHEVMEKLLQVRHSVSKEIEQISSVRASTREELYKRIYRARDFAAASYNLPITLDEMAKVACLSRNHFLRTFKQIFHQTPHQYLTGLRIRQAKNLLEQTDLSIITICQSIGFESHTSFSWLFRRHTGLSPENYRSTKR